MTALAPLSVTSSTALQERDSAAAAPFSASCEISLPNRINLIPPTPPALSSFQESTKQLITRSSSSSNLYSHLPSSSSDQYETRSFAAETVHVSRPAMAPRSNTDRTIVDHHQGDRTETSALSLDKGKGKETPPFDRFTIPDEEAILAAATCMLVGESGESISFGDLVKERRKVVVVFLRHMWCGLCQQYVEALQSATTSISLLPPSPSPSPANSIVSLPAHSIRSRASSIQESESPRASCDSRTSSEAESTTETTHVEQLTVRPPLYIILISSGSPSLIPVYRRRLDCPFPLYAISPRSRALYNALGMNLRSLSGGKDEEKGSYVKKGRIGNVVDSTISGLSMLRYPGDQKQLGGEFVFESSRASGLKCIYASRMSTTRNHSEVRDLFAAAGVELSAEDESSVYGS